MAIIINRAWAMPSRWTFQIPPIKKLLDRYVGDGKGWIDPFAGENSPAEITNDIEGRGNKFNMDALDFLKSQQHNSAMGCLFDPPYSVEQCLRRYTPIFGGTAGRATYWRLCKDEIGRVARSGSIVIFFCWDSSGLGKERGFKLIEILLVCHGGGHNDTIVPVERKVNHSLEAFV